MTNFDFLISDPQFNTFSSVAVAAEKILPIDPAACVLNCRRAMEFAVKWMYSVDKQLVVPYQDNLVSLINTVEFVDLVDDKQMLRRLDFLRRIGNTAAHSPQKISKEQAQLALKNLFYFLDFVACCYSEDCEGGEFNSDLLEQQGGETTPTPQELDFKRLMEENAALREELTRRREVQIPSYVPRPADPSEYLTRKLYIDTMLQDAGWTEGKDWIHEFPLEGMPNRSEIGYADYVLLGDDGRPLAVLEAKCTCKDVAVGRQQAKLYADLIEQKFGRRPIIFLSNGFETRIWNDRFYNERPVSGIYAKRDLEKEFNKMTLRTHLNNVKINDNISGRYYQKEAIKAVCHAFDTENRRKALLVMATGSGKTRTVISIVDVLLRHGWIKNVLFLADRNSLVTQAKRAFVNLLPDLSITNLCEDKKNLTARAVFSTYQTMMGCIDDIKDEEGGKLFTVGHFDLIVVDEAHRSIYRKYQDIFNYFDAHLVGLTATPRDEIDKNTYSVFQLEEGVPTYGYELAQAVQDGYLVDYRTLETTLKFVNQGITYEDLPEDEKEEYENTFTTEEGDLPENIAAGALNEWVFNEDTIRKALDILMTNGIRVDYGNKLGKSIIFAKNHRHAEEILRVFNENYPAMVGWARVIDNYTNYAQSAIDEFSDPKKLPQIAISVDMLDTGIDVPEVVNLVFFKKVMSKAKFWQMIGRGTRLCPGLLDGKDKDCFYIFDLCDNFAFFRQNPKGKEANAQSSLQERIFNLKAAIVKELQALEYQTEDLILFRKQLVSDLVGQMQALDRSNFAVWQHLRYVEQFSSEEAYQTLVYENLLQIAEVAPLLPPSTDDATAVQFDSLMYGIELAYLVGKKYTRGKNDLVKKIRAVADIANIPAISEKKVFLNELLNTNYIEDAGINQFERIRKELRDLIKYIPVHAVPPVHIDLAEEIVSSEWHDSELENDDLQNYKLKVNHYIRQNKDQLVIAKLHGNQPLTEYDVKTLEKILWNDIGTKEDYEKEYGDKPLGELVREIVGLDMNAAKEAFSQYLNDVNLDQRQIYFVNQIVNYVVKNGLLKDMTVLQSAPFTDHGSIVEVFTDLSLWMKIKQTIDKINANAVA